MSSKVKRAEILSGEFCGSKETLTRSIPIFKGRHSFKIAARRAESRPPENRT
jgi:hypothetical protein